MSDSDDEFTYESDSDYGYEVCLFWIKQFYLLGWHWRPFNFSKWWVLLLSWRSYDIVNESFTEDQLLEKREVVIGEIADVLQVSPELAGFFFWPVQ